MQKHTRFEMIYLGLLVIVAVFAINCGEAPSCPSGTSSTSTSGNDEYKRLSDVVSYRAPGTNDFSAVQSDSCWRPFPNGSSLTTDNYGEAQLNLSNCSDFLYLFRDSQANYDLTYQACGKMEYGNLAGGVCVANGTVLTQDCSLEFTTGSGMITKQSSAFSLTYLPETETTILALGEPIIVPGGKFTFTMPDYRWQEIEGLKPRQSYPVIELPKLLPVYPIQEWMIDVYKTSPELNVQPDNWPKELGGDAESIPEMPVERVISLELSGSQVKDPGLQNALFSAIDWKVVQDKVGNELVYEVMVGTNTISPLAELSYNPNLARKALVERGYEDGFPILILVPEEDGELEALASVLAEHFKFIRLEPEISYVLFNEYELKVESIIQAGENVLIMRKR